MVPKLLELRNFERLKTVSEQMVPNGDFPTLPSPNPEDPKAFGLALEKANDDDDMILTNDPDADRLGVMVRGKNHDWQWLNGNLIGVLLLDQMLSSLQKTGGLPPNGVLVTTIVTSPLMSKVARFYGLEVIQTLTGFKWIRDAALRAEQSGNNLFSVWKKAMVTSAETTLEIKTESGQPWPLRNSELRLRPRGKTLLINLT